MRQSFARRAGPGFAAAAVIILPLVASQAQTRDQIRERDEQLYQQQQEGLSPTTPDETPPPAGSDAGGDTLAPASGGNLTAQLLDRVSALEQEVRTLRGRVDELQQDLQTSTAALDKQMGDLSFQLQQGAGGGRAAPANGVPADPAAIPPPPEAAPRSRVPPPPPRVTPETALRQGNAALAHRDYDAAAADATTALHGPHAAEAQYLLGSAYAGQRNYQQAAVAYYGAYTRNPHGPMAPGALLHVGTSMAALGQTGAACEALGKLRAEFPALHGGVGASAVSLQRRLHC